MNSTSLTKLQRATLASLLLFTAQAQAGLFGSSPAGHIGKDGCLYKDATLKVRIPTEENVIAIDQSEAFSPTHKDQVRQLLTSRLLDDQEVPVGSHITVYAFGREDFKADGSGQSLSPTLSLCKPRQDGNEWTENVKKIQHRFQKDFLDKVFLEIDKATGTVSGGRSPIMETVQFISNEANVSLGSVGKAKHLVLVSDLLQNSEAYSDYSSLRPKRLEAPASLLANLEGWQIKALTIRRYGKDQKIQTPEHQQSWKIWFEKCGASKSEFTVLP